MRLLTAIDQLLSILKIRNQPIAHWWAVLFEILMAQAMLCQGATANPTPPIFRFKSIVSLSMVWKPMANFEVDHHFRHTRPAQTSIRSY